MILFAFFVLVVQVRKRPKKGRRYILYVHKLISLFLCTKYVFFYFSKKTPHTQDTIHSHTSPHAPPVTQNLHFFFGTIKKTAGAKYTCIPMGLTTTCPPKPLKIKIKTHTHY